MIAGYIAWVTITADDSQSPHSVLVRDNGATEPPDYRVSPRARIRVQMLKPGDRRYVEVCNERLVIRDSTAYQLVSDTGLPIAEIKSPGQSRI